MQLDELIEYWTLKGAIRYNHLNKKEHRVASVMLEPNLNSFITYNDDFTIVQVMLLRINQERRVGQSQFDKKTGHENCLKFLNQYC